MFIVSYVVIKEIFEEAAGYTAYICDDLDNMPEHLWITRVPNWEAQHEPRVGDIGYIRHKVVLEGKSQWYDADEGTFNMYRSTEDYFEGFIRESKQVDKLMLLLRIELDKKMKDITLLYNDRLKV